MKKKSFEKQILFLLSFWLMSVQIPVLGQNYNTQSTLPGATSALGEQDKKVLSPKPDVENVVIVYKTHFDIGYSETVQQVLHDYRTSMCDKVLEAIDKNSTQPKDRQFVWTISGWPMKQILWEGQSPERKQKLSRPSVTETLPSMLSRSLCIPSRQILKTWFAA